MLKTRLFKNKHLKECYNLQKFLEKKGIVINIYSDCIIASKFDIDLTEFLFIEYPENIGLLIEYWIFLNDIEFYDGIQ